MRATVAWNLWLSLDHFVEFCNYLVTLDNFIVHSSVQLFKIKVLVKLETMNLTKLVTIYNGKRDGFTLSLTHCNLMNNVSLETFFVFYERMHMEKQAQILWSWKLPRLLSPYYLWLFSDLSITNFVIAKAYVRLSTIIVWYSQLNFSIDLKNLAKENFAICLFCPSKIFFFQYIVNFRCDYRTHIDFAALFSMTLFKFRATACCKLIQNLIYMSNSAVILTSTTPSFQLIICFATWHVHSCF